MGRVGPRVCDRCSDTIEDEDNVIVLHSLKHRIGTSEPWFRLELCVECGRSFKRWRDEGPKP